MIFPHHIQDGCPFCELGFPLRESLIMNVVYHVDGEGSVVQYSTTKESLYRTISNYPFAFGI